MLKNEVINFKYRTPVLANIVSFIFLLIYLLLVYLAIKSPFQPIIIILLISLITLLTIILMNLICKKISIISGNFEFKKNELIYSSLNKSYIIKYEEIEYISKESYIDYSNIFNIEKYLYRIKIKNAKYFTFSYYDDSLINAMEKLASYTKIKIDDATK